MPSTPLRPPSIDEFPFVSFCLRGKPIAPDYPTPKPGRTNGFWSRFQLSDEAWEKSINDEVDELLAKINIPELVQLASSLNNNRPCTFQPGKHLGDGAMMGCANYHAWLLFEDGEKWLIRTPRTNFSDVPMDLLEYMMASEYATLKFLSSTNVPAPRAFGFGLASDASNRVGVSYLLMEALPGRPYYQHDASIQQQQHVLRQLAQIMAEIGKHPMPQAGSPLWDGERVHASSVASNRFVSLGLYGPFDSASDYLASIAEQHMDLITDGQLYPEYPKEAFLFYRTLRKHAGELSECNPPGTFYLKHVDDKGDHLLVDDDFNITGIIDWQFARFVPMSEAFGPSYVTADLESLYSSRTGITEDDKYLARALREVGAEHLAQYFERPESMRKFHHGLASELTLEEARGVLKGMLTVVAGHEVTDLDAWIEKEWAECLNDDMNGPNRIEAMLCELPNRDGSAQVGNH